MTKERRAKLARDVEEMKRRTAGWERVLLLQILARLAPLLPCSPYDLPANGLRRHLRKLEGEGWIAWAASEERWRLTPAGEAAYAEATS